MSPVFPTFLSEKGKEDVLLQWDWEQEVASRSGVCNPWFCVLQLWPHPLQMSESLELGFVCVHTFTVVCEYVWVESVLQNVHLSWMLVHHHLVYFPSVSVFSVFTAGLSSVNPAGIMSAADTFFFDTEWEGVLLIYTEMEYHGLMRGFSTVIFLAFNMWLCGISIVGPWVSDCCSGAVHARVEGAFLSWAAIPMH